MNLDEAYRDPDQLTSSTLGILQLTDKVMNVLQLYLPLDAATPKPNALTSEPIRLLTERRPIKYRYSKGWCWVDLCYEVKFALTLSGVD